MTKDNKAGNTATTNREYEKREKGQQSVPTNPAENLGQTSKNCDDLKNPEQKHDKPRKKP